MKKIKRRLIAATVAVLTAALQFSPVGAQTFKQGCIAETFDNFAAYSLSGGRGELPGGWKTPTNSAPVTGVLSATDSETGSKVIKLPAGQSIVYPFSEVINTGKVYVSFDLKQNIGSKSSQFGSHIALGDIDANNVNNYWYDRSEDNTEYGARLLWWYLNSAGEKKYMYRNTLYSYDNTTELSTADNKWHKYEWIINLEGDQDTAAFYLDGEEMYSGIPLADNSYNRGIKDFYFKLGADNENAYLDNWYVKHYGADETIYPEMTVEYDKNGVSKNGSVELAFSEKVTAYSVQTGDVKVCDMSGAEQEVDSVDIREDGLAVKISFADIKPGKYSVEWIGNGCFRNGTPKNKAYFTVKENIESGSARYYINEDFEEYNSGIPNGFRTFGVDPNMLKASMHSAERDSGKALELDSTQTARFAYDFKYPLRTGRYTIEFDVNADESNGWMMRLLDEAAVEYQNADGEYMYSSDYNDLYKSYKESQGSSFTEDGWKNYIASDESKSDRLNKFMASSLSLPVIGANSGGEIGYGHDKFNGIDYGKYKLSDKQSGWTHVKAVIDFNSGKYEFKIGDGEVQAKGFNAGRWHRAAMVNKDTLNRTFVHGIGGISFENSANGKTMFDNIKVFKDNSYVLYDDFNSLEGSGEFGKSNGSSKPGWYIINENGDGVYGSQNVTGNKRYGVNTTDTKMAASRMFKTEGKNSADNEDRGVEFQLFAKEIIGCMFDTPIKGTNNFAVEFDVKTSAAADGGVSDMWRLGLMNEKDTQSRTENTAKAGIAAETGLNGTEETEAFDYTNTIVMGTSYSSGNAKAPKYRNTGDFRLWPYHDTAAATSFDSTNVYKNGEWNHIKLTVVPTTLNGSKAYKTKVEITNSAGTNSLEKIAAIPSGYNLSGDNDIYGISFSGSLDNNDWTKFSIDNLKVYEEEQAVSAELLEIGEIGFNGEHAETVSGISSAAKGLRAEFSVPLKSTNGIEHKYSDNSSIAYEKELSADGRKIDIIFSDAPEAGKNLVLTVGKDAEFDFGSYLSVSAPVSKIINVINGGETTVISDFRMYEKFDDILIENIRNVPGGLYPVTNDALNGKNLNKIYLVAKGYTTKASDNLFVASGGYSAQGEEMKDMLSERNNVKRGEFEIRLNLGELNSSVKNIRGFVWNADNFAPLDNAVEYGYVAPNNAE